MTHLFSEWKLRGVTLPNRIGVSPMCQYSCADGFANDWHFAHLAARAVGGAGLVFTEAAAVTPEGRISPEDLGVWSEKHSSRWSASPASSTPKARSPAFSSHMPAARRARSGRGPARRGRGGAGGWRPVAPSAIAFAASYPLPEELTVERIARAAKGVRDRRRRALMPRAFA